MDSTTDAPSAAVNLSTYHSPESRISQSHDDGRSPLQKASFNGDSHPEQSEAQKYSTDHLGDGETSGEVISSASHSESGSPAPNHWGIPSPLPGKDLVKPAGDPATPAEPSVATHPILLMPQALQHQVQQLLREQFIYPQFQTMLLYQKQQQEKLADFGRKQLETVMQQLQEQLHVNLIQQTQLMDLSRGTASGITPEERKKSNELVQTLAGQQQQLIQQLQLAHRHYLLSMQQQDFMANPLNLNDKLPNGMHMTAKHDIEDGPLKMTNDSQGKNSESSPPASPSQAEKLSTNITNNEETAKQASQPLVAETKLYDSQANSNNVKTNEASSSSSSTPSQPWTHPLFLFGVCRWPGCESPCEDSNAFIDHLNKEHVLDDRSTAQTRVQMQVVAQLELQLQKERDRLQSMMDHLNRTRTDQGSVRRETPECSSSPILSTLTGSDIHLQHLSPTVLNASTPRNPLDTQTHRGLLSSGVDASEALQCPAFSSPTPGHLMSKLHQPNRFPDKGTVAASSDDSRLRKRGVNERSSMHISEGFPYLLDRTGLDVHQELTRNREFYRNADVRPPFTYASLIRQAIIESPERQLTLNEIYTWFQNTFCYFRHNAATWKNAIRTNLSLHKCFVRYEDDFGSFWMVDDAEFLRRRHLARGRPRKFDMPPAPPSSVPKKRKNVDLQSGALQIQPLDDQTVIDASNVHSRSPNLAASPTLIAENGNKSLPIALAESNINYFRNCRQLGPVHNLGYPFSLTLDAPKLQESQDSKSPISKRVKLEGQEERMRQAAVMAEEFLCRANLNPFEERGRDFKEETYHSDEFEDESSGNQPKLEDRSLSKSYRKNELMAKLSATHARRENGFNYSNAEHLHGRKLHRAEQPLSMPSIPSTQNGYRIESTQVKDE